MLKLGSSQLRKSLRVYSELVKLQRSCHSSTMEMVKMERVGEKKNVALVTLDRPKAYNALCDKLIMELTSTLVDLDKENSVGAIVITGSMKAFAAGADIRELHNMTFASALTGRVLENWTQISKVKKPVIAAVNGYALGGGCELAMMCDIVYAGEQAMFGQPEVTIGTVPGAGGTQRWTRVAGKSLAMELCLTGKQITAKEAKECGIVSKIHPVDLVVAEAIKTGELIASYSPVITQMIKDCVNRSFETSMFEGLRYERRMFHATMGTKDQKEGMSAFLEKRKPEWTAS